MTSTRSAGKSSRAAAASLRGANAEAVNPDASRNDIRKMKTEMKAVLMLSELNEIMLSGV